MKTYILLKHLVVLLLGIGLASCTPKEIPKDANHEWDIKNGSVWYWSDKHKSGCTSWMASERWISVQLTTVAECSEETRHDRMNGQRITYSDFSEEIRFREYGPWNADIRSETEVYDDQGHFLGFLPCPHEVTRAELSQLKRLSKQASTVATTDSEKTAMEHIRWRLDRVDLSALSSSQFGCTDEPLRRAVQ